MTLKHMKIFVTVCQCNSVTAAANKLFIAQPSVSLAIRELEDDWC
jgi:DNA-binding transcriptional LysR family regulator